MISAGTTTAPHLSYHVMKNLKLVQLTISSKLIACMTLAVSGQAMLNAQPVPSLVDSNLHLRTVVSGLEQPTSMAFLGADDILVLEKASGKVKRVTGGVVASTVLDLAVNSGSERGLLGIALHPKFPENPGVYLYWTESTTGVDTTVLSETPLLGNRVDRFVWDGAALTHETNITRFRAFQEDAGQNPRGNHDG